MMEGYLWRLVNTLGLNYPFTSKRMNELWGSYRLSDFSAADKRYWDEYSDFLKDTYGIAFHHTGLMAYSYKMYDVALWCFNNALKLRVPWILPQIYQSLGETYLAMSDPNNALANYQETLKRDPQNPYAYAKEGLAYLMMNQITNAKTAFQTSLSINPNQKEALSGLQQLKDLETRTKIK